MTYLLLFLQTVSLAASFLVGGSSGAVLLVISVFFSGACIGSALTSTKSR